MHDPMTVIYRNKLITLWHIDPESDGSDDSCGWLTPKLGADDEKIITDMVEWDLDMPYYSTPHLPLTIVNPKYDYPQMLAGDCLSFVAAAWLRIAWGKGRRRKLTSDEWWAVADLACNPHDNIRSILADSEAGATYRLKRFFYCVMKAYLRHHRPWWKHPKYHVRHWRLQIHPIDKLKRRLFSRCAQCGEPFPWGYCPTALNWDSKGPSWFRGEEGVYHSACLPMAKHIRNEKAEVEAA